MPNNIEVSVVIPCRDEKKFIAKCLNSIIVQDFPKDKLEVLVVDGMSEDETREIINKFKIQNSKFKIQLIDNPKKITPCALNIGIKKSKGEIIIRMDAHATYRKDYISKCLKYLKEYKADNVGGIMKILPAKTTIMAKAIAISFSHPFGAGSSYYKRGSEKTRWVDTVFGGCYKKEVFSKIGPFNEKLIRSQDIEFNLRLKRAGGKILLVPEITSYYYPKSNLKEFFKRNFLEGLWVIYPLRLTKAPLSLRHYIPLVFVTGLIGLASLAIFFSLFFWLFLFIIILYILVDLYFSVKILIKKKDLRYLFLMPIVFAVRHLSYGLGSVWGILTFWKIKK